MINALLYALSNLISLRQVYVRLYKGRGGRREQAVRFHTAAAYTIYRGGGGYRQKTATECCFIFDSNRKFTLTYLSPILNGSLRVCLFNNLTQKASPIEMEHDG